MQLDYTMYYNIKQHKLDKYNVNQYNTQKKGCITMQNDYECEEKTTKAIRFENNLIDEINELRKGTERNFSQQVKFMIRKYIEITKSTRE